MPPKSIADAHGRNRTARPARPTKPAARGPRRGSQSRVLRIIAGTWRGRRLRFSAEAPIRPTPDRVRETLFNWLGTTVVGARCLDLFAGSGALGLEALSRGAASVQFIERDAAAARELARLLEEWGAGSEPREVTAGISDSPPAQRRGIGSWNVRRMDALDWLTERPSPFEIVFVDPPFDSELAAAAAERLERRGWLAERALIYVEHSARTGLPPMPARWTVRKSGRAGEVGYHLLERVLERAQP